MGELHALVVLAFSSSLYFNAVLQLALISFIMQGSTQPLVHFDQIPSRGSCITLSIEGGCCRLAKRQMVISLPKKAQSPSLYWSTDGGVIR